MSNTDSVNQKTPSEAKPKFSSYLRAVDTERLQAANNQDKSKPLVLKRPIAPPAPSNINAQLLQATGVLISTIWLTGAAYYVQRTVGWSNVSSLMPHELGGFLAGILTPIALFWMIAAFVMRSNDVKMYAETLREEIQRMIFPSEEADRRVNNDIERLMRQTAEMSKATQYALTALDAAREAVKGQVLALNGSSEETLDRLSNLSNNLQDRTRDVVSMREQLDQTLGQLDDRSGVADNIVQKLTQATDIVQQQTHYVDQATNNTKVAVTRLSNMLRERLESLGSIQSETEQALVQAATELKRQREELRVEADYIEEKSYGVADALDKGLSKLYDYSDDALDKAKLIETRLQGQTSSIEHVLTQANQTVDQIQQTATNATSQLSHAADQTAQNAQRIETIIQQAIDRLQDRTKNMVDTAAQNADAFSDRLNTSVAQIGQTAETAVENTQQSLDGLMARLAKSVEQIEQRAQSTIEKTQGNLGEFTESLVGNIQGIEDKAKNIVQQTQNSLGQFADHLVGNIAQVDERAKFAVHQAQNSMSEMTGRLVTEVDGISERAKSLTGEMLTEVNRKVTDTTAAFVYIQKQIQALVTLFDQRKMHLDQAGSGARETAEALQRTLQAALNKVEDTTKALQSGIASIHRAVQEPIASLENAASMAATKAVDITNLIDSKATVLTDAAHKIGQDVTILHEQLHGKGQDVALLAGKIATHLKTVTEQIDTQHNVLDQNLQQSVQQLHDLSVMQKQVNEGLGSMQDQTLRVVSQIETLKQTHQSLADDAQASESRLGEVSDRLINISGNTVDKVKQTLENLTLLEADYHRLADASVDDIQKIETGYRKSLQNVENDYRQSLEAVQNDTQTIAEKMQAIYQAIQAEANNTQINLETSVIKLEQATGSLEGLSRSVVGSLDSALNKASRVQDVGNHVQVTLTQIGSASEDFDRRVVASKDHVATQAETLQNIIRNVEDQTMQAVTTFMQQGKSLQQETQNQLLSITDNVEKTTAVTDHLRKYLDFVRTQTQEVETSVGQSIERLTAQGDMVESKASQLVDKVNQARDGLVEQGEQINAQGDDLLQRLANATAALGVKATALEKAADTAQRQSDIMREQENKTKRDMFFNSTKFVVESLHSLALDFTRLLDGELNEKTWVAYQKGDTASFTRRLLNGRNEETQGKIQTKFKDDPEFRTYVQRYLRQFEEIYDQAESNDHADLLTNIFISSDVGKLYKFLSTTLGRETRGAEVKRSAA